MKKRSILTNLMILLTYKFEIREKISSFCYYANQMTLPPMIPTKKSIPLKIYSFYWDTLYWAATGRSSADISRQYLDYQLVWCRFKSSPPCNFLFLSILRRSYKRLFFIHCLIVYCLKYISNINQTRFKMLKSFNFEEQ